MQEPPKKLSTLGADVLSCIAAVLVDNVVDPADARAFASTCAALRAAAWEATGPMQSLRAKHERFARFAKLYLVEERRNLVHLTSMSSSSFVFSPGDKEIEEVTDLIRMGCMTAVGSIQLDNLRVESGAASAASLFRVIAPRTVPNLTLLSLSGGNIADAGMASLSAAIDKGSAPKLEEIDLTRNSIGDVGIASFAECRRALQHLCYLWLSHNSICDKGAAALSNAFRIGSLRADLIVDLSFNRINDVGVRTLAASAPRVRNGIGSVTVAGNPGDIAHVRAVCTESRLVFS